MPEGVGRTPLGIGLAVGGGVGVGAAALDVVVVIGDIERPTHAVQGTRGVILAVPLPNVEVVERLAKLAPLGLGGCDDPILGVAASGSESGASEGTVAQLD